jgi:hypothetical protein
MRHRFRAFGIACLAFSTAVYAAPSSGEFGLHLIPLVPQTVTPGQVAGAKLLITVVDGEAAVNDIKARTAREPVVEVTDENHKPIAGAAVTFFAPSTGPGGTFAGQQSLTVLSDSAGRAVGRGFAPNNTVGQFRIEVTATYGNDVAKATILQSNFLPSASAGASAGAAAAHVGLASTKLIVIFAAVAAAGTAGLVYGVTHSGNNAPTATISSPGSVSVGAPH